MAARTFATDDGERGRSANWVRNVVLVVRGIEVLSVPASGRPLSAAFLLLRPLEALGVGSRTAER